MKMRKNILCFVVCDNTIPVCREEQIHHQRARRITRRADERVITVYRFLPEIQCRV